MNIDKAEYKKHTGWVFYDAVNTNYTADGLMPYKPQNISQIVFDRKDMPETPEDILNAIKDEEDLPSWVIWDILSSTENMSERLRNVYTTLFYYRLAFP